MTPKTDPPRPVTPQIPPPAPSEEIRVKLVGNTGAVEFRGIRFGIGRATAGQRVCVMDAGNTVMVFDLRGTLIIEHPWPKPGTEHVSNGAPADQPLEPSNVSDVLIHQLPEMS
ncbi:hypothetical protein [Agromyces mariniharenae]|uniref:hypothetical protein n=1 Tax=Agromyces mariniharenae TaxID=2604423 RepID=UPI00165321EE|nr:hypothetical protein [Agromyces mariniharenae]